MAKESALLYLVAPAGRQAAALNLATCLGRELKKSINGSELTLGQRVSPPLLEKEKKN